MKASPLCCHTISTNSSHLLITPGSSGSFAFSLSAGEGRFGLLVCFTFEFFYFWKKRIFLVFAPFFLSVCFSVQKRRKIFRFFFENVLLRTFLMKTAVCCLQPEIMFPFDQSTMLCVAFRSKPLCSNPNNNNGALHQWINESIINQLKFICKATFRHKMQPKVLQYN